MLLLLVGFLLGAHAAGHDDEQLRRHTSPIIVLSRVMIRTGICRLYLVQVALFLM